MLLAVVLLVVAGMALPVREWSAVGTSWLRSLGLWAIPVFVAVYVLVTVACLPNVALILVAGTVFGLPKGIAAASVADTLGAIICFVLGRTIARQWVLKWMRQYPDLASIDNAVGREGWKILLLSRLSPMIPSNLLNYGFSCTKVGFWPYILSTWLGMLPVIGLYVYLGYFGSSLFGGENSTKMLIFKAGGVVLTVGAGVYATRMAKAAIARGDAQNGIAKDEP
ncbi:MAG: TVP38/TMEM64 family protein [Elainellaceae cyanobacterium]